MTSKSSHNYFGIPSGFPTAGASRASPARFPSLPENSISHWFRSRSSRPAGRLSPLEPASSTCSRFSFWLEFLNFFSISPGMPSTCRLHSASTRPSRCWLAWRTSRRKMFPTGEWHTSICTHRVRFSTCLPKCLLSIWWFCNLCRGCGSCCSWTSLWCPWLLPFRPVPACWCTSQGSWFIYWSFWLPPASAQMTQFWTLFRCQPDRRFLAFPWDIWSLHLHSNVEGFGVEWQHGFATTFYSTFKEGVTIEVSSVFLLRMDCLTHPRSSSADFTGISSASLIWMPSSVVYFISNFFELFSIKS